MKKNKKTSKTTLKRQDQKINVALRKKYEAQMLDKDRKLQDFKDEYIKSTMTENKAPDIQEFNAKNFLEAMKDVGLDTSNTSPFADMERMVNSNEAIRELVDIKNIRMKTKVTEEQHRYIVILYGEYNTLLKRYGIAFSGLANVLNEFIEIAPSIEGKRAEQFVTAHQAVAQALANLQANNNAMRQQTEMKQ